MHACYDTWIQKKKYTNFNSPQLEKVSKECDSIFHYPAGQCSFKTKDGFTPLRNFNSLVSLHLKCSVPQPFFYDIFSVGLKNMG